MSKITGKNCTLTLTSVVVAPTDLISISVTPSGEKVDNTGMGDDWATFLSDIGGKGCEITINGYNDSTATPAAGSLRKAIMDTWAATGHMGVFSIKPTGSGQIIGGTLILDTSTEGWAKADSAVLNATATVTGAVTGL